MTSQSSTTIPWQQHRGNFGNIEFWGANYQEPNDFGIPNANSGTYDFGDRMTSVVGDGSIQVHNHGASQTIFAYNNWASNSGGNSDLGIGNNLVTFHDSTETPVLVTDSTDDPAYEAGRHKTKIQPIPERWLSRLS